MENMAYLCRPFLVLHELLCKQPVLLLLGQLACECCICNDIHLLCTAAAAVAAAPLANPGHLCWLAGCCGLHALRNQAAAGCRCCCLCCCCVGVAGVGCDAEGAHRCSLAAVGLDAGPLRCLEVQLLPHVVAERCWGVIVQDDDG